MVPQHDQLTQLRRLLVLKRYEQPPPGYFDHFSTEVLARIHAGERIRDYSWMEALSWEAPWLQRLWSVVENRPMFAGAFGMLICSVLIAGALYSEPVNQTLLASPTTIEPPAIEKVQIAGSGLTVPDKAEVQFPSADGPQADNLFRRIREAQNAQPVLFNATPGR